MQEVASSTHSHAAHARPHAGHHPKVQRGSGFAAMLDEMAPPKSDTPADASTAAQGQSPEAEQSPEAAVKAADAASPPQVAAPPSVPVPLSAPAVATPDPDQELKTAALGATPNPEAPEKQDLLLTGGPDGQSGGKQQPTVTDKPVLPALLASQTGAAAAVAPPPATVITPPVNTAANVARPPAAAPAQSAVTAIQSQQAQPGDDTLLAPNIASAITGSPRLPASGPKSAKPGQAPAELDADGQPQGVAAPAQEQGALSLDGAKPAMPAVTALTADKASTPEHRSSLELASAKSDATQTFDDLLGASTGQTDAAAANGSATGTNSQTNTPAAATANAPAPQAQLAPVPLSGVPVLIAGKALAGSNHFDIRLDPPELGRIEVRLKVDRDGQVSSHLIADRADTLALLRRDQTGLERALQDAGLKTTGEGLQFSLRDQGGNGQPDGRAASPGSVVQDNPNPLADLPTRGYASYVARLGGIDIHV